MERYFFFRNICQDLLLVVLLFLFSTTVLRAQITNEFGYETPPDTTSSSTQPVGSPSCDFSVSPMGGSVCNIDFEAPKGFKGMQPQFGLKYGSMQGNGLAGFGMNVSGLSAITRIPGDIYHDGAACGLSDSMTGGKYALDGQRLLVVQGAVGDSIVFCPENNPYVKVILHGLSDTDQRGSHFSVTDQQGNLYEYSAVLSIYDGQSYKAWTWHVTRMENPLGNYMTYEYQTENLFAYPSVITYGLHTDLPASIVSTISFVYESRPDTLEFRVWGHTGKISRRIKTVITKTGQDVYRKYVLTYSTDNNTSTHISRLSSVEMQNGNGEAMNPVQVSWDNLPAFHLEDSQPINTPPSISGITLGTPCFSAGDFNGDGISDIVWMAPGVSHTYGFVYLSDCTNDVVSFYQLPYYTLPPNIKCSWDSMNGSPLTIDFDGDGLSDLLFPHVSISGQNGAIVMLRFYGYNINSAYNSYDTSIHYDLHNSTVTPLFTSADFNNDGRADIVILEKGGQNGEYDCQFYAGHHRDSAEQTSHLMLPIPSAPSKLFASDFNGDGLSDLLVAHSSGYTIFWNQGGHFTSNFSTTNANTYTDFTDRLHLYLGDFNGDGLADFLASSTIPVFDTSWKMLLNDGKGRFTEQTACSIDAYDQYFTGDDDNQLTCIVTDIDGDGKSDAIISKAMYSGNLITASYNRTSTYWLTSTGNSLEVRAAKTTYEEADALPHNYMVGDFNGDGLPEISQYGSNLLGVNTSTNVPLRVYRNPNYVPSCGKVKAITDGYGRTTSATYSSLSRPSCYTKGTDAAFPVADYTLPLGVVTAVTTNDGAAGTHTTNYSYGGLKIHLQGRGYLGFTSQSATCSALQRAVSQQVTWNTSLHIPAQITETQQAGNEAQTTVTQFTAYQPSGIPHAYFQYPYKITATDMDGNTSITFNGYDTANGCPSYQTVRGHDNLEKTVQYSDYVMASRHLQPSTVTHISKYATTAYQVSDVTKYTYEWHGLPETVCEHYGTSLAKTTTYQYDGWGNTIMATTSANGVESATDSYIYDSTRRFVVNTYSHDGTRMGYTHDTWGNVLSAVNNTRTSYPLTTTYTYDGWGRLASETSPEGRRTKFMTRWGMTGTNRTYYTLRQGDGQPWLKTWYDITGRETRTETREVNDWPCTYNMTYDAWGRLTLRQRSEYNGMYDFYEYDNRGRTVSHWASGILTSYSYSPNTVTTTKGSQQRTVSYDSWGNVTTMTDAAGTVNYHYNGWGKPRLIAPAMAAAPVKMEYDAVGNRTKLIDPDASTMTYNYDAYGRVVSQKDGRGVETAYTYDAKGRVDSVKTGGAVTAYTYGSSTSNMGLLVKEKRTAMADSLNPAGQNNCIIYHYYDSYARPSRDSWSGYGYAAFNYTYDNLGRLSTKALSGMPTITYQYDCYGNMVCMLADGNNVWEQVVNEEYVTEQTMGLQLDSYTIHDSAMRPTESGLFVGSEPNERYPMYYEYSPADGNIASRSGMFSYDETFTYDSLDRLTTVSHSNGDSHTTQYSPWGNITWQTGIGGYHYLPERPHAVAGVDNTVGSLPSSFQEIVYNDLGKAARIADDSLGYRLDLFYGPNGERWQTKLYQNAQLMRTTSYRGDIEEVTENGVTTKYYYLGQGVLYVKKGNAAGKYCYMVTDLHGSITHIVDYSGNEVFTATYDAWGRQTVTRDSLGFRRGYTGHEHLTEFGLINMNGRLYDPLIARFLSCDNFVQEPANSQSFNRYSYCLNNPLRYVDPDGEIVWFIVGGAVVGGIFNVVSNFDNINSTMDFLEFFGVGAAAGALGAVTGGATFAAIGGMTGIAGGAMVGLASGTVSGGFLGIGNTIVMGGSFQDAIEAGLYGSLAGGLEGMVTGGILGGVEASLSGRDLRTGAERMVPMAPLEKVTPQGIQDFQDNSNVGLLNDNIKRKPIQEHHFASNKNKTFTPDMKKIAKKYGLDLNGDWNKEKLPHIGRHPNAYHEWVLDNMKLIDEMSPMNQEQFIILFDKLIKQPVKNNPNMLYKPYWKK